MTHGEIRRSLHSMAALVPQDSVRLKSIRNLGIRDHPIAFDCVKTLDKPPMIEIRSIIVFRADIWWVAIEHHVSRVSTPTSTAATISTSSKSSSRSLPTNATRPASRTSQHSTAGVTPSTSASELKTQTTISAPDRARHKAGTSLSRAFLDWCVKEERLNTTPPMQIE